MHRQPVIHIDILKFKARIVVPVSEKPLEWDEKKLWHTFKIKKNTYENQRFNHTISYYH